MDKLTPPMIRLIEKYHVGCVATVNADGTPAVSPKATFVIVSAQCIAYGDIRSPGTAANIAARPAVEVNFVDVLARRAVRVKGVAQIVAKDSTTAGSLLPEFEKHWGPYIESMNSFVRIDISHASLVLSPAYDHGATASELTADNLKKLQS